MGYGDNYPVTGRCVAVVLMLAGIGLIGALTATMASYFVGKRRARKRMTRAGGWTVSAKCWRRPWPGKTKQAEWL